MIKKRIIALLIFIIIMGSVNIIYNNTHNSSENNNINYLTKRDIATNSYTKWDALIYALIWVESRWDATAKNKKSTATGVLQQLNVYVKECNRLLGTNKFTLDDRYDIEKSIEMFNIIQRKYNPEKDIEKAIILHRGLKSESYIKAVKSRLSFYAKELNVDCM